MIKDLLTAEQARELSKKNRFKQIELEYDYVFGAIKSAAEKGMHRVDIQMSFLVYSKETLLNRLKDLKYNFSVSASVNPYINSSTDNVKLIITWDEV